MLLLCPVRTVLQRAWKRHWGRRGWHGAEVAQPSERGFYPGPPSSPTALPHRCSPGAARDDTGGAPTVPPHADRRPRPPVSPDILHRWNPNGASALRLHVGLLRSLPNHRFGGCVMVCGRVCLTVSFLRTAWFLPVGAGGRAAGAGASPRPCLPLFTTPRPPSLPFFRPLPPPRQLFPRQEFAPKRIKKSSWWDSGF